MQMISAFLVVAAPYAYLLWLIPAALVLYFLGWLVRGIELSSTISNHEDTLSARELALKKIKLQLEQKELQLDELKHHAARMQEASDTMGTIAVDLSSSHELTHSDLHHTLSIVRNEREQLHNEKFATQRHLDEHIIQLEHTQRRLKKYERATTEYEEKFSALKTKYKQRDAKLYGEIVELRAYIFDLKAAQLETEKEHNTLRESAAELDQVKQDSKSSSQSIRSDLKNSELELQKLQVQSREQASQHRLEVASLKDKLKSFLSLETTLKQKSEQLEQMNSELDKERQQSSAATEKLQQITEKSQHHLI